MAFKCTAVVLAPNDEKINYSSGVNPTRAEALAELVAKLALVCGKSVISASMSETIGATELATLLLGYNETVPFEEATLVLRRAGVSPEPPFVTKNVTIENMGLVYKLADVPQVDMDNDDLVTFVTAFYDGAGRNGFVPVIGASKYAK